MVHALARPGLVILCAALAGCEGMPRGAAFQNEVLGVAASAEEDGQPAPFQVVPVTEATLPLLAAWPNTGGRHYAWISARNDPANVTIAPGDRLDVTIWESNDNSLLTAPGQRSTDLQPLTVSSSGRVNLPYVGDLRVQGMSPERARGAIESALQAVIPAVEVQVSHAPGRGNQVSLVGGVGSPGTYPMSDQSFTILALLSDGGGVAPGLENPQVRLMRGGDIYGTSISRLYENPALDTTLRPGDRVIVAEDDRYFLSLGAAGAEAQHPFGQASVSALDAMSIIGGVDDERADPQGILILREYPERALAFDGTGPTDTRVVFTVDLTSADGLFSARNFEIMPGDLVYATESPVTSARGVLTLIGSVIGTARVLSN